MTDPTPERIMRARVIECEDYATAADSVLADIDLDDRAAVGAWLEAGVYALARTVATRVRMAETQRLAHAQDGDPERIVVRVPVVFGRERRFRSATLADCGKAELLTLAQMLEAKAAEDMAKARAYRRLYAALDAHNATVVRDLPPDVIAGAFDDDDATGRKAA